MLQAVPFLGDELLAHFGPLGRLVGAGRSGVGMGVVDAFLVGGMVGDGSAVGTNQVLLAMLRGGGRLGLGRSQRRGGFRLGGRQVRLRGGSLFVQAARAWS